MPHEPASRGLSPRRLRRLEYRGYDSVGVALQTEAGTVARLRTTSRISALESLLDEWSGPTFDGVGIGHTRWATHGAVTETNAHPHSDCGGRLSLVHNGIIENATQLRTELSAAGHRFTSTVDSEVLCHLIEDERSNGADLTCAVQNALAKARGSWALAVLEHGTGRIAVAASGSPLVVANTSHGDFATSDVAAIADWADEFRVLEDGDVVELSVDGRWTRAGILSAPPPATRCTLRTRDVELDGYTDFMAKEIDEQLEAVARVLDSMAGRIATGALWRDFGLPSFERLRVIGCGTSLNAGTVIGNLARDLGGIPMATTVASEAAMEVFEAGQLCLAISQSGETADVLRAVESPAVSESSLVALTNSGHSTLARLADAVVGCAAGPEIGVAATKTFVCQVVSGSALMISALVAMRRLSVASASRLVDELRRLPEQLDAATVTAKSVVPPIAEELAPAGGFLFIARGLGLPYASEGALKLKELTYRWAEHYPAGELKHGPLALVGTGTPVIAVGTGDPKIESSISEIQARGGNVASIGSAGSTVAVTDGPNAPWGPITATVALQILARTMALTLGRDVDKPRNLAKSVTVE